MSFQPLFWDALTDPEDPREALWNVIAVLQAEGIDRDIILWELMALHERATDHHTPGAEAILELMSALVGFRSTPA